MTAAAISLIMSLYDVEHFDSTQALYSRLALPYVPRILHLMDQNPYSPNYGCFDRAFWHYSTMDFPCGMSQEMVLLLALVYKNSYPGNSFHQVCRIKELSEAAIKFLIKSSHKDGTCDDYFPFERAMGALVFSLYAASESYLVLEMEDQEIADFFIKRVRHLEHENRNGQTRKPPSIGGIGRL